MKLAAFLLTTFLISLIATPVHAACKEHIELLSAKEIANELGKSEMWVLMNYKINVWEKSTPDGKGRKVGEMRPGSRAVIIEEGSQDFKIKSPLDKSIGWVNIIQIKGTLMQDTETRRSCQ